MVKKLLIVTPMFFGDTGGASIYYQKLRTSLIAKGVDVQVVSEKAGDDKCSWYWSVLPKRSGVNKRGGLDYVSYAFQNIAYFYLFFVMLRVKPDVVLVHTSFLNHAGVFGLVLKLLTATFGKVLWVGDARDPLITQRGVKWLKSLKRTIVCSENVLNHYQSILRFDHELVHIPVIQEELEVSGGEKSRLMEALGLNNKYILYVGAIKQEKAVDKLIDAYISRLRSSLEGVELVLVGLIKTTDKVLIDKLHAQGVRYLGAVNHLEAVELIRNAALCVNLSPIESMPRFSLESLALKVPSVLPPNVPEFQKFCNANVCNGDSVNEIESKCIEVLRRGGSNGYPISDHYADNVIAQYCEALEVSGEY